MWRPRTPIVLAAIVLGGMVGCAPKAGSLEGHACGQGQACLAGYACVAGRCVANVLADGGVTDGGVTDAGVLDGGTTDGGLVDGGTTDGGVTDGGIVDGGPAPDGGVCVNQHDDDHDGYRVCDGDCNDHDPNIHPGAREICDGKDDNCDGKIDNLPASYAPPTVHIEIDGKTPTGRIQMKTGDPASTMTAVVDSCAYAGCPTGQPSTVTWYLNTRNGPVGGTSQITVGPTSSSADLTLPVGLHEVLLDVQDRCHSHGTARAEIEVGDPVTTATPKSDTDIRAVCTGPGQDEAWIGTNQDAQSLNPDLSSESADTTTAVVHACAVNSADRAFYGRNNTNDWVLSYDDRTKLSSSVAIPVTGNHGNFVYRGMVVDGTGRVWGVSGDHLRVYEPGGSQFKTVSSISQPPDGGKVSCVTYDGNGHLWVCTDKGVNRLDVSATNLSGASADWWRWQTSRPIVDTVLGTGTASALAANGSVLWLLTQDVDNVVLRFDLTGIDGCGACDLTKRTWQVDVSYFDPPAGTGMNDIVLWQDGDVMIGADSGLYRLQSMPPTVAGAQPTIWETMSTLGRFRDLAVHQGSSGWTLYGATDNGVFRYRGP